MLHDSRVAVRVVAHDNPLDMTTVRGKVIEIMNRSITNLLEKK